MSSLTEISQPQSQQNLHRNRMTPFPRSSILNLSKSPASLCSGGWERVMQERKQAVGDRTAQRKHLRAVPLLKPGSCKTTLVPACQAFPKGLWASGVQLKDYQASSWQSPLGSQRWLISKKRILLEEDWRSKQEVTLMFWNMHPMGQDNF